LGDNDFLRAINDEVTTLIIHALSVADDLLIVGVAQMTLAGTYHNRDFTQLNLACLILFDEISGTLTNSSPFLNVDIDLGIDLVGEVSDSRFVWKVGVHLQVFVDHHGLGCSINLSKHYLIANIVFLFFDSRNILPVDTDDIALVFFDAVGDHNIDKAIEGLNLLVDDSVLLEVSVNDLPLIII